VAPSKYLGLHAHRFDRNPEERRFAEAWAKQGDLLNTLLTRADLQHHPHSASRDEHLVAATVIQWLGSPVGQSFLEDLGYTKKGAK
jgi:hypothetical protein